MTYKDDIEHRIMQLKTVIYNWPHGNSPFVIGMREALRHLRAKQKLLSIEEDEK